MLTYQDIKLAHFRNIGKSDQLNDATLLADFNYNLGNRYQLILANIASYINESPRTTSTVAAQQYYDYPPGIVSLDNISITIGSMQYTLSPIYDQATWNQFNALQIQPSAIPQFYFPRKSDYGIWPIPQASTYTINYFTFDRDRNMAVDDYTGGTIILTNGDKTVAGTSTAFTSAMVGRFLTVTNTATPGQGYWYRVASVASPTSLELDKIWASDTTAVAVTYRIGECPQIPEEAHILLPDGTACDFFAGLRAAIDKSTWWENKFWAGSGNNNSRDKNDKNISSGLIGLIKNYEDRDKSTLIYKTQRPMSPYWKIFAQSLS